MIVAWLDVALDDLERLRGYIAADNPRAAAAVVARIRSSIRTLASFPARGRIGQVAGTRELVVSRTPYVVIYRVQGNRVEILRVLHGARKWPP